MASKSKKDPYAKEIKLVEKTLLDEWVRRDRLEPQHKASVFIGTWTPGKHGVRVTEVSMTTRTLHGLSGCSFMACDTEQVPFLCERLIIELKSPPDAPGNDAEEFRLRLLDAIFGKEETKQ